VASQRGESSRQLIKASDRPSLKRCSFSSSARVFGKGNLKEPTPFEYSL